jgi:hypothetical protein
MPEKMRTGWRLTSGDYDAPPGLSHSNVTVARAGSEYVNHRF